ncbi:ATP-binding cassette domain-containing protein [Mumia sp. zg.B17]|uniref:ABC transporter ATP-binding protein n=1 Tax=unclassified Mumia TaxID=2621872 RepID=UPI001C6E96CF|nr:MULTISPECIES: ATP-binding cassette domain-containing protein [unclassified Mumia]MBW9206335.1 ATP-binding cassette domain-containing protein [Mumia sp. zg.B17]MBW9211371.1 ATP-binding cassette domain-containing protein [Mumia sp. zg.B21]
MSTPMLEVTGLTVSHADRDRPGGRLVAVDDVSLSVGAGEILGLVGESGCGKSTLARAVVGLQPVDRGSVLLDGVDARALSRCRRRSHRRRAQMVFQNPFTSLDPHRTIGAAITEALAVGGTVPRAARRARVADLLDLVGLDPALTTRRPRELSGGQCQRVAIARALAVEPRLLVCDEPVTALDVSVQARILNLFMHLRDTLGTACLFITHDLSVLAQLADRIAVMHEGRIVEDGPTHEVLTRPRDPQTRRLLDAVPTFARESAMRGQR